MLYIKRCKCTLIGESEGEMRRRKMRGERSEE
jgi:hypothetical protein